MGAGLNAFFAPRSIAVIGASRTPGKIGYCILESLKLSFSGKIYPVNPQAAEIAGLRAYPSVLDIEEPIDLAIIAVRAELVKPILAECIKKGIKSAVIISSGFSEIGRVEAEQELKKLAKGKIRILGPNCLGIYQKGLDMLFLPRKKMRRPLDGQIGFITQSGAVGSTMLDQIAFEGVGISKFISYGNALDVNEIDLLEFLEKDLATRAIAMYIESVRDGKKFMRVASKAKKPIIALKAGKTQKGAQAVLSHTGALTCPAEVYSAAFKQCGIIEARTTEQLFDYAKALSSQPALKSNKIAILTDGGGFGILAADEAVSLGFELPKFSPQSISKLKALLPKYAIIDNPLDLTGAATTEWYAQALEVLGKDKAIDAILAILLVQVPELDESVIDALRDAKLYGKPIVACMMGSEYTISCARKLESYGIPVYPSPERAARALYALRLYTEMHT